MIEVLVSRLDGAKRTGYGRYIARCPAHADKSPSLSIQEQDGNVLFHCFAGCEPENVLSAVGLTFSDLYPERITYSRPKQSGFNPYDVLKCLVREGGIIALASAQILNGEPLSRADTDRVILAHERLYDAARLVGVRL
jgi:hypothetical protein